MKIRPVGAELFHADGRTDTDRQTDTTKLTVSFRNFVNAPKKYDVMSISIGLTTKQSVAPAHFHLPHNHLSSLS